MISIKKFKEKIFWFIVNSMIIYVLMDFLGILIIYKSLSYYFTYMFLNYLVLSTNRFWLKFFLIRINLISLIIMLGILLTGFNLIAYLLLPGIHFVSVVKLTSVRFGPLLSLCMFSFAQAVIYELIYELEER